MLDVNIRSPKIAIFGDLHLGIKNDSPNWHQIALNWCDWFVSDLRKKEITDIFFLGDFFHCRSDVSVATINVAAQILDKLKDFNIVMIVGNHCCFYRNRSDVHSLSILKGRPNITVIDENHETVLYGKKCIFLPWGADLREHQKGDYIFGHIEIQSFKITYAKVCDFGFKSSELLKCAKLIFSGHFHLREERKYKEGDIVYIGNPFQMDYSDLGSDKGYYTLDINTGQYEFIENLVSPRHIKVKLSQLGDQSSDDLKNNVVTIVVDREIQGNELEKYSTQLNSSEVSKPFSLQIDSSYTEHLQLTDVVEYKDEGVKLDQVIEEFVTALEVENKEQVIDYCKELYKKHS